MSHWRCKKRRPASRPRAQDRQGASQRTDHWNRAQEVKEQPMSIEITAIPDVADAQQILSNEALAFIEKLHQKFAGTRDELLAARAVRRQQFSDARFIDFDPETQAVRTGD